MPGIAFGVTANTVRPKPVLVDENGALVISGGAASGTATVGTAGAPAAGVQSVQGVTGGTPLAVQTQGETTNTPAQVVVGAATSTTLGAATPARIRYTIYNPTAAIAYVRKGAVAASATVFDFVIPAGMSYFSDAYEYAGEMRVFSTPGGTFNFSQSV